MLLNARWCEPLSQHVGVRLMYIYIHIYIYILYSEEEGRRICEEKRRDLEDTSWRGPRRAKLLAYEALSY
jgi:hypothetical protein